MLGFGFKRTLFSCEKFRISVPVAWHCIRRYISYSSASQSFASAAQFSQQALLSRVDSHPVPLSYHIYPCPLNEPPLYILHGLFGSKSNWNSLAKALSLKRPVITVDSRNHGSSPQSMAITYDAMVHDLKSLIDHLGHRKVHLMGHSMGGKTCMILALQNPELVEKLVVVDVSPTPSPSGHNMRLILDSLISLKFDDTLSIHAARKRADHDLSQTLPDVSLRHFLLTNLVKREAHFGLRVDPHIIDLNLDSILGFPDLGPGLVYHGRTMFVGGGDSTYISADTEPDIRHLFPGAQIHHIPHAGHWVHAQQPRLFLTTVNKFLAES